MSRRLPLFALAAAAAVLSALAVSYSQAVPLFDSRWIVEKRMKQVSLLGATATLLTRSLFAGGQFRPATWYGYQEINTKKEFRLRSIRLGLRLRQQSHLSIIFGAPAGLRSVLRVSRSDAAPAVAASMDMDGRFIRHRPIPALQLKDGSWHILQLDLGPDRKLRVSLDSVPVGEPLAGWDDTGRIGLRGGHRPATVSYLQATEQDGSEWRETFSNFPHFGRILLLHVLIFLALCFFLLRLERFLDPNGPMIALCTLALGLFAADYFQWSKFWLSALNSPVPMNQKLSASLDLAHNLERIRFGIFGAWAKLLTGEEIHLRRPAEFGYPAEPEMLGPIFFRGGCKTTPPSVSRSSDRPLVLFIGTSQTFGSGADHLDQTFFCLALKRLASEVPGLQGMNLSRIAGNADYLLDSYRLHLESVQPRLVVINLGFNDGANDLRAGLTGFLELNRARGIRTVLLTEAVSREDTRPGVIGEKHEIIRELGTKFAVPVWPLHDFLSSAETHRSGFLWWDDVHLSNHGHALAADWLVPRLRDSLLNAGKQKKPRPALKAGKDTPDRG